MVSEKHADILVYACACTVSSLSLTHSLSLSLPPRSLRLSLLSIKEVSNNTKKIFLLINKS